MVDFDAKINEKYRICLAGLVCPAVLSEVCVCAASCSSLSTVYRVYSRTLKFGTSLILLSVDLNLHSQIEHGPSQQSSEWSAQTGQQSSMSLASKGGAIITLNAISEEDLTSVSIC